MSYECNDVMADGEGVRKYNNLVARLDEFKEWAKGLKAQSPIDYEVSNSKTKQTEY